MEPKALDLKDIHLPELVGWWPPAIGWWLAPIFILLLCTLIVWLYKYLTRKTAIKTANKQLLDIKENNTSTDIEKLANLSALLRRVAISISSRNECASLTGQAWLEYLNSTVKETPFTEGVGRYLATTHYKKVPDNDFDISQIITLCENWLKAQKNKK
ncbi:MAG: DUF4381 domain-containing protein [Methylococcales bacterium]|nr:DUF4381 domain-containing protein [Methylococcales bacterium]